MKAKVALLISSTAVVCMALASCDGGHRSPSMTSMVTPPPPPPPPPPTMDLDTAAVLAIVKTMTSESADPFPVDGGVVVVTPVGDETSSPISVDST
jgi:hypothetical protein